MHKRHCLGLSALFLLLVTELQVQCAPAPAPAVSVYDKLVELTTSEKCTYLQNTTLLQRSEPKFLLECGSYEDVIKENLETFYNLEKLHCLLYYDTFEQLCAKGKEDLVKVIISESAIKNADNASLTNVCDGIRQFYKSYNASKVASIMQKGKMCEKHCDDRIHEGHVFKACGLSALMIHAQQPMQSKPAPVPQSAQDTQAEHDDDSNQVHMPVVVDPVQSVPQDANEEAVKQSVLQSAFDSKSDGQMAAQQPVLPPMQPKQSQSVPVAVKHAPVSTIDETLMKSLNISAPTVDKQPHTEVKPVSSSDKPSQKSTDNVPVLDAGDKKPNEMTPSKFAKVTEPGIPVKPPASAPEAAVEKKIEAISQPQNKPQQDVNVKKQQTTPSAKINVSPDEYPLEMDDDNLLPGDPDPAEEPALPPPREKPLSTNEDEDVNRSMTSDELPTNDSYFFSYFMMFCILFVMGYVGYHNKQKLLALILEGRRGRRQPRRRPNSANYHKLDSNLEEAVTSSCDKTTSNVIY